MSFTESQPININDLAIEEPIGFNPDQWKKDLLMQYFTSSEIKAMDNSQHWIINRKIVFGQSADMSLVEVEMLRKEYLKSSVSDPYHGAMLASIGLRPVLSETERNIVHKNFKRDAKILDVVHKPFTNNRYSRTMLELFYYQLIDPSLQIPESVHNKLLKEIETTQLTGEDLLSYSSATKLMGVNFEITNTIRMKIKSNLRKHHNDKYRLADAADLVVLESDGIVFDENGFTVLKKVSQTNLQTTPQLPTVRNF